MEKRKILFFALILCIFHFLFLLKFFAPAISTPDAQGYFTQGRIIAENFRTCLLPENNLQYIGPHWHTLDGEKYFTTFPPGFPLLIAIFYKIFGANSAFLINPLLASLGLFIFFLFCKTWISEKWALLSAFFLAINPFYNEHALFGDSHITVIFFFLLSLLFLRKAIKKNNAFYAAISGITIGFIPLIRYAEFILTFIFAIYILYLFCKKEISLKTFILFISGAGIPVILLAVRNQISFGKFWMTGYGITGEQSAFGFNYLIFHFIPFLTMLITQGMGILFFFSIPGFVKFIKKEKGFGIYLLGSLIFLTLIYMAYYWEPDPQSMRFLLPTFPIYTFTAVYFLKSLKKYQISFLTAIILFYLPWGISGSLKSLKPLYMRNKNLVNIRENIEKYIKEGSIIITYEGICQYLDFYGKWKLIDIGVLSRADTLHRRPLKPIKNKNALKIYNSLKGKEFKRQLINDICEWKGKIFLIAYENESRRLKNLMGDKFEIEKKNVIEIKGFQMPRPLPPGVRHRAHGHPKGPAWIFDFQIKNEPLIIYELKI